MFRQHAQKISESLVNNCYGLVVVTLLATPEFTYLWKSWLFHFEKVSIPQKLEFSNETLLGNALIVWQHAQKISESLVNNYYGLVVVTLMATPEFTYENPSYSTLKYSHSRKS